MTQEEMDMISENINKQQGRKYPCSNQIVVCGFFASEEAWNKFVKDNLENIKIRRKNEFVFINDERWIHFSYLDYSQRGYRFYKLKVSHDIDYHLFFESIYSCSYPYCKEIEWI